MWFATAAAAVFALGSTGMLIGMVRSRRVGSPTTEGRRRAERMLAPWIVLWCVCALAAAVLIVVGDPGMLIFMSAIVVFVAVVVGVGFVVGRRMDREDRSGEHET